MKILIKIFIVIFLLSCSPSSDSVNIGDVLDPPEKLKISEGQVLIKMHDTQSDISLLCGDGEVSACMIKKDDIVIIHMPNPCVYRDSYSKLLCHEWAHYQQYRSGLNLDHQGWKKP